MNTRTLIASLFVAALLLTSGTAAMAYDGMQATDAQNSMSTSVSQGHWGHGGGHGGGYGGRGGCGY